MSDLPDSIDECITSAAAEVHALIVASIAAAGGVTPVGSSLEQAGMVDGDAVVSEYLANGEPGLALEHVIYMASELEFQLSTRAFRCIDRAGRAMVMDPAEWVALRPASEPSDG